MTDRKAEPRRALTQRCDSHDSYVGVCVPLSETSCVCRFCAEVIHCKHGYRVNHRECPTCDACQHCETLAATLDAEREAHTQTAARREHEMQRHVEVEAALAAVLEEVRRELGGCPCDEGFTARGMHEPNAVCHVRELLAEAAPGADALRAYVERAADKVSDVHVKAIEDVRSILVDLSPEPLLMKDTRRLAREYVAEVDTLRAELARVENELDAALEELAAVTSGDGGGDG